MQEGDVVLTPVPQADGTMKNRPAIVLREMPVYRDVLVCGVSTQLHQYVQGFDEIISPTDADFASSGLVSPSLIRLGFLAVVPRRNILGTDRGACAGTSQALIAGPEQLSSPQPWGIGRPRGGRTPKEASNDRGATVCGKLGGGASIPTNSAPEIWRWAPAAQGKNPRHLLQVVSPKGKDRWLA